MSWLSDWRTYETEQEARIDAQEHMDFDDFSDHFACYRTYDELLKWAMEQPNFFSTFEDDYTRAKEDYFSENYWEEVDYDHDWSEEDDEWFTTDHTEPKHKFMVDPWGDLYEVN